jgi:phosphate transport system substrate-binding protein
LKQASIIKVAFIVILQAAWILSPVSKATALEGIKYRCSHQIFNALEKDNLAIFSKETNIKVDAKAYPSDAAVNLLVNGYCDIASTANKLDPRLEEKGFKETAICRDPLAVIAHVKCGIDNLTDKQVESIFSGEYTNWKELGGPDLPIMVVIPGENTAANKNFKRLFMTQKEFKYGIMTAASSTVIELVNSLPPGAISFISHGAVIHNKEIKALSVNGVSTNDVKYPFSQTFYYVTKGEPTGDVKKFVDFIQSENGKQSITKKGISPVVQ